LEPADSPRPRRKKVKEETMEKREIGRVSHYFGKPQVAAIVLSGNLKVGDKISFEGHTTDFEMIVSSIQIEHDQLEEAKPGDNVGIRVPEKVREHDVVCKIVE
jgi:translation elongation factor EF-1alpha